MNQNVLSILKHKALKVCTLITDMTLFGSIISYIKLMSQENHMINCFYMNTSIQKLRYWYIFCVISNGCKSSRIYRIF